MFIVCHSFAYMLVASSDIPGEPSDPTSGAGRLFAATSEVIIRLGRPTKLYQSLMYGDYRNANVSCKLKLQSDIYSFV
jgi:hypothetical protein